jgi:hypothetical protein
MNKPTVFCITEWASTNSFNIVLLVCDWSLYLFFSHRTSMGFSYHGQTMTVITVIYILNGISLSSPTQNRSKAFTSLHAHGEFQTERKSFLIHVAILPTGVGVTGIAGMQLCPHPLLQHF